MSMTPKTALVWFRRDLRLDDHPALLAALDSCEHIVPVYIDDRAAQGDWTPGKASDWWLHHSLASLQDALEAKGSPLVIREGEALEVLRKLIEESGASEVHWNRLYEPWTRERDTTVKQALEADGLTVCSHNGSLLTEPWTVMTKTGTPYKVFTPYWRAAIPMAASAGPEDAPVALTPPKTPLHSQTLQSLGLLPDIRWDKGIEATWQPGERAAAEQAQKFAIDAASNYDEARNLPGIDGVSRLSPHLHFGELSIRRLW
ncbi:MAG: deoxyribodipyrimidine photo-lyase, partial [Pseudomonadota bacterium]